MQELVSTMNKSNNGFGSGTLVQQVILNQKNPLRPIVSSVRVLSGESVVNCTPVQT